MKHFLPVLIIFILLAIPISASGTSRDQSRFINNITNSIEDLTSVINVVDMTNATSLERAQADIRDIIVTVEEIELPEDNRPVFDVIKYTCIQGMESNYDAFAPGLRENERLELLTNSTQYMLVMLTICNNVNDICY